ncbi:MAG: DUF4363 family protein [Firmicutes bacterium]|nr:DUF4363 family protein [Bacillota bacterium]
MKKDIVLKVLFYFLPAAVIVIFLVILNSFGFIKSYLPAGKQIPAAIDNIENLIIEEAWGEALQEEEKLQQNWNKLVPLIQISTTEENIKDFTRTLNTLEGYLRGKEKGLSLAEVQLLRFSWQQLEN